MLATFIVYWAGWSTYTTLMVGDADRLRADGALVRFHLNPNQPKVDWGAARWVFPYLIGMGIISYFGGVRRQRPAASSAASACSRPSWSAARATSACTGTCSCSTVFSLVIYYLAMASRLPAEVDEYVRDVYPPPVAE